MHVGVIGTGYVGLVTGTCFADLGIQVTCVDSDEDKVAGLKEGRLPIYEPGLDVLVAKNRDQGRLQFTTDLAGTIRRSLVIFLAVGTPPGEGGLADLSAVEAVAEAIGENLNGYKVIVTKSTVPAGTGARVRRIIEAHRQESHAFDVVSNPEFLREGSAIEDFMRPDRIVIGAESQQAIAIVEDLYRPLTMRDAPVVATNVETAEMIKYASNAFLATKVAYINEISSLCDAVGADVKQVARGMGLDGRIGEAFLNPGPGYGGSCFPKDTRAFAALGRETDAPLTIVEAVMEANRAHVRRSGERVLAVLEDVEEPTVAVLGLSFKPDTDDMREAPAVPIVERLLEAGVRVRAFDPEAMANARDLLPRVTYCEDSYKAAEGADLLLLLTEWNQFRALDWERLKVEMKEPVVLDLRNLYEPAEMRRRGLRYHCLGRTDTGQELSPVKA